MHTVGIDVGSTNVKVALVAEDGALAAAASRPLRTVTRADAVEQDPDALWAAVVDAVREATAAAPAAATDVVSLGVCSQYSSIVPVGEDGAAVGPLVMYLDHRGTDECWRVMERHPEAFELWVERHGIPPIGGGLSLAHLLHLQRDDPERHARTVAHLEAMDLVNLRLTGRIAATQCTMFAAQLCDNRRVGTDRYDPDLLRLSGVDAERLPPLIGIDATVGEVRAEVAAAMGLPTGVTVAAGMNDTHAGAFATGTVTAADQRGGAPAPVPCGLVVGTTAVLVRPLEHKAVDLGNEVLSMPAPIPGRHVVMAENGVAGRAVEHCLSLLDPSAGSGAAAPFDELADAVAATPAGCGGLLFLPWLAGSMSPSSSTGMRGAFVGISLDTTRSELLRSTVEGVARNLRWLLPAVEGLAGGRADRIVFAGGAARSRGWAQVVADVLGAPVDVLERPEVAAARAVGMVALRRLAGDEPTEVCIPVADSVEPDHSTAEVHDRLQPLFEGLFTTLRPFCEALRP